MSTNVSEDVDRFSFCSVLTSSIQFDQKIYMNPNGENDVSRSLAIACDVSSTEKLIRKNKSNEGLDVLTTYLNSIYFKKSHVVTCHAGESQETINYVDLMRQKHRVVVEETIASPVNHFSFRRMFRDIYSKEEN